VSNCLIGHTGFVGSNLLRQISFDAFYNSSNITAIKERNFDLVVCAGVSAVKWKANQNPEEDLANINVLINNLKEIEANYFILISTVDVYKNPVNVNEDTVIDPEQVDPYGRHRYYVEKFIKEKFNNHLIIRLPALFGSGLKKNFIYDLIHNNCLHLTHCESAFQFYNLDNLWQDTQIAIKNSLSLVNFVTEPVMAKEIASYCLGVDFTNITDKPPVYYDMRSKYCRLFGADPDYMYSKKETLEQLKNYITKAKEEIK